MNTFLETRYVCSPTKREHVVVPVQLKNYLLEKSPSGTFITDYPQNVHGDVMSEAETKVPDTILTQDEEMLDANVLIKDEVSSEQEAMLKAKIQMQDEAITKQKAMFEARIHMVDQVILEQKAIFEGNIHMEEPPRHLPEWYRGGV
ncbi:uncharacterized protein [Rutidosis leptorrhynchoides]|uniref:uncharacterized protein n=1 Tax=Rutidosis leptorrhynchoides TaxID=125765 RepID=UPI003A99C055